MFRLLITKMESLAQLVLWQISSIKTIVIQKRFRVKKIVKYDI